MDDIRVEADDFWVFTMFEKIASFQKANISNER